MGSLPTVLLSNTYFYRFDAKQWKAAQPYPPLGTIYAAAQLRQEGYEVRLFDTNLEEDAHNIRSQFEQHKPTYYVIYDDGFNYLTKMCLSRMKEAAFDMIRIAKEYDITVIVSSSDSTDHDKTYLEAGADYVIHGEGEITLTELLQCLVTKLPVSGILGISYYEEGAYLKNPGRPVMRDLDLLPQPAWDLIDIGPYREVWEKKRGYLAVNIATTRGCPYKCNWCAKPIYGNRYNSRSPERVIDEIEGLIKNFDVRYFWMCDDIFGLKPMWVQEFNRLKKERNLTFQYKIQSRVDLMLKEDNLDALADSGAHEIWVGAESGSQKILDAMDKGTQVEEIYEATRLLKERDVRVAFFIQFGYPGEAWEDINKTINMILELMPDDLGISVSYPLPGTKFYERVKSELTQKANWVDSDDLDLMFANTYSPLFYKTLHRYVHDRYRIKKGWLNMKEFSVKTQGGIKTKILDIAKMVYHLPQAAYRFVALRVIPAVDKA